MSRRTTGAMLAALAVSIGGYAGVGGVATASEGVAHVRIVDKYNHGRVEVSLDGVSHLLRYGDRTGSFLITPDPNGNDGISVASLRYDGCGMGDAGNYFNAGHHYRVVVRGGGDGGYCQRADGSRVAGPGLRIHKVS